MSDGQWGGRSFYSYANHKTSSPGTLIRSPSISVFHIDQCLVSKESSCFRNVSLYYSHHRLQFFCISRVITCCFYHLHQSTNKAYFRHFLFEAIPRLEHNNSSICKAISSVFCEEIYILVFLWLNHLYQSRTVLVLSKLKK